MPQPLKKGYNFFVEHIKKDASYQMRTTDVYTDFYGIGFIISGDRNIITPNGVHFLKAGDIICTNIGLYHRTTSASDVPYERYGIRFTPKMVERLIGVIGEATFRELMSHIGYQLSPQNQAKVIDIYEAMLYEYEHYDFTSELIVEGLLNRLLITVLKERIIYATLPSQINVNDDIIMNIIAYLDLHYAENPSIKELAHIAGLSQSHFMKRFKMTTGSTYKTYLNHIKVYHAQLLLTRTNKSIGDIADTLGFCNANYFSNVFREFCRTSPMEYRKHAQGNS